MRGPVDTSGFQREGVPDPEEDAALLEREIEARNFIASFPWAKPIASIELAIGFSWMIVVFLVRFTEPIRWPSGEVDEELWVVVGDLPPAHFATDDSPNTAEAIETYCQFMDGWIEHVRAGISVAECYPVRMPPTAVHADMLELRLKFIRENIIPLA